MSAIPGFYDCWVPPLKYLVFDECVTTFRNLLLRADLDALEEKIASIPDIKSFFSAKNESGETLLEVLLLTRVFSHQASTFQQGAAYLIASLPFEVLSLPDQRGRHILHKAISPTPSTAILLPLLHRWAEDPEQPLLQTDEAGKNVFLTLLLEPPCLLFDVDQEIFPFLVRTLPVEQLVSEKLQTQVLTQLAQYAGMQKELIELLRRTNQERPELLRFFCNILPECFETEALLDLGFNIIEIASPEQLYNDPNLLTRVLRDPCSFREGSLRLLSAYFQKAPASFFFQTVKISGVEEVDLVFTALLLYLSRAYLHKSTPSLFYELLSHFPRSTFLVKKTKGKHPLPLAISLLYKRNKVFFRAQSSVFETPPQVERAHQLLLALIQCAPQEALNCTVQTSVSGKGMQEMSVEEYANKHHLEKVAEAIRQRKKLTSKIQNE